MSPMKTNNPIIADLHNHSTASDGDYSPTELLTKAREIGLKAIALTDHDTMAGLDEAKEAGRAVGIMVIPGIEVTLRFLQPAKFSLHLLLYFSDALGEDHEFKRTLNKIISRGRGPQLVKDRVKAINDEFGPNGRQPILKRALTVNEVQSYATQITRRHFALALKEKNGQKDLKKLIANDSPAYIPSGIDLSLLSELTEKYQVAKILAHPAAGSYPGPSHFKEVLPSWEIVKQLLPQFLNPEILGLDGFEVHYPGHTPEYRRLLLDLAAQHGLIVSGGSDCHDSETRPLGVTGVTQNELDKLLELIGPVT